MTAPMTTLERSDALRGAGSGGAALTSWLLAAGVADTAVLASWAAGALPATFGIAAHMTLACGVCLFSAVRRERAAAAIAAVSMLAMGPVGAIGALVLARLMRRRPISNRPALDRHRGLSASPRPDPADPFCEAVREGRAFAPEESRMRRFAEVLADGDLSEKQALLGAISIRFHPDQMPILRAALRSSEPPVRVSAAAVFARLREVHRSPLSAQAGDEDAVARAGRLADAARSGLLSASEAGHARGTALGILLAERPASDRLDAVETLLCGLLLEDGHDDEIERRLAAHAGMLPPALKAILLRARMRGRRYDGIASLAGEQADTITALDQYRRPAQRRPLLATSRDGRGAGGANTPREPDRQDTKVPAAVPAQPASGNGVR